MSSSPMMPGGGGMPPAAGMLMSALQQKGQGGGGGDPAQDYAQQSAELQGADPGQLLEQLNRINQLLGVIFVQNFQRLPNVANQVSATMKQLSRAIKEAQQAASTQNAMPKGSVGGPGASPINFSAASPSIGPQAGMPQGA